MIARPRHVYGLDVAGGRATVIRMDRSGRSDVLARDIDFGGNDGWSAVAGKIMAEQVAGVASVAAAIPAYDGFFRAVEAPFSSEKKARLVFPSLLDVQIPLPLEQCAAVFVGLGTTSAGLVRAMAVAAPRDKVKERFVALNAGGVDPEWLVHESLPLWSWAQKAHPSEGNRSRVVLYLGRDRSVAVAGDYGGPRATTGVRMVWMPADQNASSDKLLVRLKQFLAGAFHDKGGDEPEYIVAGPLAREGAESLKDALSANAVNWKVVDQPELFMASALAGYIVKPDKWTENLRQGDLAHRNTTLRQAREHDRVCALLVMASIAIVVACGVARYTVAGHHDELQTLNRKLAAEITGIASVPRGQEVFLVGRHLDESAMNYRAFQDWLTPSAYPEFSRVVRQAHARNIALDTLSIRPGSMLIRGRGTDWNDPDHLTRTLSQDGWKVDIERDDVGADERIPFVVRAQR
ncbi:MAG TPA: hypothetical protein PJ991_04565 [Kiritimatiellia bacterium]|nr:hypothetical protein [Kiritimatiellia bacterium]